MISMKAFLPHRNALLARSVSHQQVRHLKHDPLVIGKGLKLPKRQRWSHFWFPQTNITKQDEGNNDATQLLAKAGYLRQAYAGIFHMLPLGLRVQEKIEKLVDKHMASLRASKVSLSSISSQKLWDKSGRLEGGTEFFKFNDRKDARWLLAPTHEEEITTLVQDSVFAPNHLPLRVYQISRKYRDEKRPRGGLLRGREFIMKDLYTFDKSEKDAHATYESVRRAYSNLFNELKLPYIEAQADSGNMGGDLSHEFHFPSKAGEDDIISCSACNYARNEEYVPQTRTNIVRLEASDSAGKDPRISEDVYFARKTFLSNDGYSLVHAFAKTDQISAEASEVNPFAVKASLKSLLEIDTGVEDPESTFQGNLTADASSGKVYYLFDQLIDKEQVSSIIEKHRTSAKDANVEHFVAIIEDSQEKRSHLLRWKEGDLCPKCSEADGKGKLKITKAIEVGHTFHLGNRYSSKFNFIVPGTGTRSPFTPAVEVSMGCHGIGVSRLIAAVASSLSDAAGLNWPRAIAPFEVVILVNGTQNQNGSADAANELYDTLTQESGADVLIDDREDVGLGWKLKDADLIGYPVIIVFGKRWNKSAVMEVQCRRLKVKEDVGPNAAPDLVKDLLTRL